MVHHGFNGEYVCKRFQNGGILRQLVVPDFLEIGPRPCRREQYGNDGQVKAALEHRGTRQGLAWMHFG